MRFKSRKTDGYQVFAVSGTNTVSFGIDFDDADTKGLLGFAVERSDPAENQRYFMFGYKVFPSVIPSPDNTTTVKTFDHPVQSFVWDDFTAKPDRTYEYFFHPLKGTPKNLDRSARPILIEVRTEPLFSTKEHDVFFNRGIASSQAYARKFDNKKPDKLTPEKKQEALEWLSRSLDEAILKFIANAKRNDTLLCCFYEFRYLPVAQALKDAIDRGVTLRLIVDAKVNESTDKKGNFHESFPREENLKTLKEAGIPKANVILREAKPNEIQHNKFMVLLKGKRGVPAEVWTGSTNLSEGGIHGQTNVGHWVRNADIATEFKAYWELLSEDPGPQEGDDTSTVKRKNKELRTAVEELQETTTSLADIKSGITSIFSPRSGSDVLEMYAHMIDDAKQVSCIYGQTQAALAKRNGVATGKKWDEGRLFEKLQSQLNQSELAVASHIFDWMKKTGRPLVFGTGRQDGSVYPLYRPDGVSINPAYLSTDGKLWLQFGSLRGRPVFGSPDKCRELMSKFSSIEGIKLTDDDLLKYPSISLSKIAADPEGITKVTAALDWMHQQIANSVKY
jgi:hypothetical protein